MPNLMPDEEEELQQELPPEALAEASDEELPPAAPAEAAPLDAPVESTPIPDGPAGQELLKAYFKKKQDGEDPYLRRLRSAEELSSKNLVYARLAQAAGNLGHSIARVPLGDQKPYEDLAADAERPVKQAEREGQYQTSLNKTLRDYYLRQMGIGSKEKISADKIASAEKITGQKLEAGKGIAGTKSDDYNKRTAVMDKSASGRLAIAGAGLDLRQGNQAAGASSKFNSDPIIKTSNSQLANIDKGLGRLSDGPFTTTIKADVEKDLANAISGGSSSSLGQLHRVEFNPWVVRAQKFLDEVHGYQGDINAPEFKKQLVAQFNGLRKDIVQIQARRSKQLEQSLKTAYSKNPLATQSIKDNVDLYGGGSAPATPAGKVRVISPDGKSGLIPEEQLDKALKAGYRKG